MTLEEVDRQLFLLLAGVDVIMSGGLDVSMACKFGNRCERDSLFQQSGAERVPEFVRVHLEAQLLLQSFQHGVDRVLVQFGRTLAE